MGRCFRETVLTIGFAVVCGTAGSGERRSNIARVVSGPPKCLAAVLASGGLERAHLQAKRNPSLLGRLLPTVRFRLELDAHLNAVVPTTRPRPQCLGCARQALAEASPIPMEKPRLRGALRKQPSSNGAPFPARRYTPQSMAEQPAPARPFRIATLPPRRFLGRDDAQGLQIHDARGRPQLAAPAILMAR